MTTILLVDEHEQVGGALRFALRSGGFDVVEAIGSESALEHLASHDVDLTVLGTPVAGGDELELCRQLCLRGTSPVVVVAAATASADVVEFLDAGAEDFVGAPVASPVLAARIRTVLRRSSPHRRDGFDA